MIYTEKGYVHDAFRRGGVLYKPRSAIPVLAELRRSKLAKSVHASLS